MEKSIKNTEGKKQKKRFFSLDAHYTLWKIPGRMLNYLIESYRQSEAKAVPLTNACQAMQHWGLGGCDDNTLTKIAFRMRFLAVTLTVIWTAMIGMAIGTHGWASFFTTVQVWMLIAILPFPILVNTWKADIISDRKFISFFDYVRKFKFLMTTLLVLGLYSGNSVAMAATGIDLPEAKLQLLTDISSKLVGSIIGEPWSSVGGNALSDGMHVVLLPILGALNTGALTFVSVFLVYIYAMGAVQGAHLGNWSDNQIFSTFWSPLRTSFALAFCAPLPSGVSTMQMILLFAVSMSINFANNVSSKFFDYVEQTQGITMTSALPNKAEEEFGRVFNAITQAAVIQTASRGIAGIDLATNTLYTLNKTFDAATKQYTMTIFFTQPKSLTTADMPIVIIESPSEHILNGITNGVTQAYYSAFEGIVKVIPPFGASGSGGWNNGEAVSSLVGTVSKMHQEYVKGVMEGYTAEVQIMNGNNGAKARDILKAMVAQSRHYGWTATGIYPFVIARSQAEIQKNLVSALNVKGADWEQITMRAMKDVGTPEHGFVVGQIVRELREQLVMLAAAPATGSASGGISPSGTIGSAIGGMSKDAQGFIDDVLNKIAAYITKMGPLRVTDDFKNTNPLAVLYNYGETIVSISAVGLTALSIGVGAVEASEWTAKGVAMISQIAGAIGIPFSGGSSAGVAAGVTAVAGAGMGLAKIWGPILMVGLGALMSFGLACCYVLPALPVIFWCRALVTWIVLVIEAMVGAPFWVAAHAFPEGVGLAGQHARQGYLIVMDLFIRPTLLVVGAIMCIVLIQALGVFLSEILEIWGVMTSQAAGYWIVGILVTMVTTIFVMYTTIKWLFLQGIALLPEQIMRWLGSRGSDTGVHDAASNSDRLGGMISDKSGAAAHKAGEGFAGGPGGQGGGIVDSSRKMGDKIREKMKGINH